MQKEVLIESYRTTKKLTGIDAAKPGNMKQLLVNDDAWKIYVESLAESLTTKKDRENFKILAENTRVSLLENSMFQINPYETLTVPILRVFYPKLIAKEAVTVSPMDKPETVKAFIKATFTPSNSSSTYDAPSVNRDISTGPSIGTSITASMTLPQSAYDVLNTQSLDSTQAHLNRDFTITGVYDNTAWVSVNIVPAVEGHFSGSVSLAAGDDVITGVVDYLTGKVTISSAASVVKEIRYTVTCNLEENKINPKITLNVDKIRLYARDRQISAQWTVHMEQDMRALFDVSMQAEIVNFLGQQIALDIDREIINDLIITNSRFNDATTHTLSFEKDPPADYVWGPKYWHENIIPKLNQLSAQIYNDTNIDAANTVLCNPLDAAILEDLNTFNYVGTSSENGELGYRSATVAGGKWKILTSAVVPEGTMIVIFVPQEEIKSIYFYSPYVPAILTPYPLGAVPSLTILSRYATALVRKEGIAVLNIT